MKKSNPNPDEYGMMFLSISRKEIEDFDHINILNFLDGVKKNARKYENKFNFMITGFDNDERELNQIEEVRHYFDFLDRCFPYWFYFLIKNVPLKLSPINLLIALLVPIKSIISKDSKMQTVELDVPKLETFINTHFYFLNELVKELGLGDSERKRVSEEVMNCISVLIK